MNKKTNKLAKVIITLLVIIVSIIGLSYYSQNENLENKISYEISNIPEYNGEIYIEINNNIPENNVLEEYNLYEKKKIFLDNKSWKGNDFAWITDEKSVCISEHGDGGPYAIFETDLPPNVKVGEVYEKINGKYVYNAEVTKELNRITN